MSDNKDKLNIAENTWIAVDTETTGINPWKYEIIEIGAVKFNLTSIIDSFQVIIKLKGKHDPKSRMIHKITEEEILNNGIDLHLALQSFFKFINGYSLVFHNASFDLSFLIRSTKKEKLFFPDTKYYDTLYLLKKYKPDLEFYSLEYLKQYLNINAQSHRALADAKVTANIFQWILSDNSFNFYSKKKIKSFFRNHHKIKSFELTLPENLESIISYFNKFTRSKSILKINENNFPSDETKNVIPIDIMIFNQKIMLKCSLYPSNQTILFPLSKAIIYDPEKGPLTILQL